MQPNRWSLRTAQLKWSQHQIRRMLDKLSLRRTSWRFKDWRPSWHKDVWIYWLDTRWIMNSWPNNNWRSLSLWSELTRLHSQHMQMIWFQLWCYENELSCLIAKIKRCLCICKRISWKNHWTLWQKHNSWWFWSCFRAIYFLRTSSNCTFL